MNGSKDCQVVDDVDAGSGVVFILLALLSLAASIIR